MRERKYEYDHYLPGLTAVAGVVAIAVGAALPLLEATGPDLTIRGVGLSLRDSVGGLADGGGYILIAAGAALLCAVVLMATHARRALGCRLLLLLIGGGAVLAAVFFLVAPVSVYAAWLGLNERGADVLQAVVDKTPLAIKPAPGAFLLGLGGLLIAIGAVLPWRRSTRQPV